MNFINGGHIHSVAFGFSVGDIVADICTKTPQIIDQKSGRGNAVTVIVAVNTNFFFIFHGFKNGKNRFVHIDKIER